MNVVPPKFAGGLYMTGFRLGIAVWMGLMAGVGTVEAQTSTARPPKPQVSQETRRKAAETGTNTDALILQDFQKRIDAYMTIHKDAAKVSVPIKQTTNPAEIKIAQLALADGIRKARAMAKPGDIMTPEIRNLFRRIMYPELKGASGREIKEDVKEDIREKDEAPQKKVNFSVNAAYPEGNALPTTPTNLLTSLPKLPEELEYRIVEKHLILRDVQANIVVDLLPNAIQ